MLNQRFVPPLPPLPTRAPKNLAALRAIRTNVLNLWTADAYRQDSYTLDVFGKKMFLFNSPEQVRHILVENDDNYARSPIRVRILRPVMGEGVLLSEGKSWRHQRRVLAPAFAPRTITVLNPHFASGAADAIRRVEAMGNVPVDLFNIIHQKSIEITAQSMFSLEIAEHLVDLQEQLKRYLRDMARPFALDIMLPPKMISPRDILRRRFQVGWMKSIERLIDQRLAKPQPDKPVDFFDLLREAADPDTKEGFSRTQLRDQVATMIIAGHETTSVALFWCLYLIASTPHVQAQIAAEVRNLDLTPTGITESLKSLVYTRAAIDEALRLYPSVFMIVRSAIGADKVGDVDVPAGSTVMVSPWVLHRHQAYWSDPEAFDPSRFLPGAPKPPRLAYLPFGIGPRVCIGAQFALSMLSVTVAAFVQAFQLEIDSGAPVHPVCVATVHPDHHPNFRLHPRREAHQAAA